MIALSLISYSPDELARFAPTRQAAQAGGRGERQLALLVAVAAMAAGVMVSLLTS